MLVPENRGTSADGWKHLPADGSLWHGPPLGMGAAQLRWVRRCHGPDTSPPAPEAERARQGLWPPPRARREAHRRYAAGIAPASRPTPPARHGGGTEGPCWTSRPPPDGVAARAGAWRPVWWGTREHQMCQREAAATAHATCDAPHRLGPSSRSAHGGPVQPLRHPGLGRCFGARPDRLTPALSRPLAGREENRTRSEAAHSCQSGRAPTAASASRRTARPV